MASKINLFRPLVDLSVVRYKATVLLLFIYCLLLLPFISDCTVMPAKSDSVVMFCLQLLSKN